MSLPSTATGTLYIYAKEDSYLYEVTADGAKELDAKWDEDYEAWKLTTRTLTSYAVSDTKLDTKTTTEDKEEGSSSTRFQQHRQRQGEPRYW